MRWVFFTLPLCAKVESFVILGYIDTVILAGMIMMEFPYFSAVVVTKMRQFFCIAFFAVHHDVFSGASCFLELLTESGLTMKSCSLLIASSMLVCFSASVSSAALVGSSRPVAQANFQKLIKTNACPSCDLAGVVLTRIDLSDANLEKANLAGAQMFLTDLSNANLRNANLQGAKLGGADLGGADLRGANLTGAVFEGAYLQGALLDGEIVSEKPYINEDLPEVTENTIQTDGARGKNIPYTQDAVVDDPRVPARTTSKTQAPQAAKIQPAIPKNDTIQSKSIAPIPNAVVHSSSQIIPPKDADITDATEQDKGFWHSVTAFFRQDATPVKDQAGKQLTSVQQPVAQTKTATTAAHSKKLVPMADAVVSEQPVMPKNRHTESAVKQEKEEGFWGSVTSLFSSGEAKKNTDEPVLEAVQTPPAESGVTGKEALAENAGVKKMIEQIEGPASEELPVKAAVQHGVTTASPEMQSVKQPVSESVSTANVAGAESVAQPAELPESTVPVQQPAASVQVEEIARASSEGKGLVYDVLTPAQAMLSQHTIIARLLDEERCVGCDLAGVDLSGKNLDEVDLERANLQGANLEGVSLEEANLKGAKLSGANLREADLRQADLYLADFSGSDLTGARFEGALIDSVDFSDAIGVNLEGAVKDE